MFGSRTLSLSLAGMLGMSVLGGCMAQQHNDIPTTATMASSGDHRISYTAPQDGTFWIYDVAADRIDYSGPVRMNQSIVVDPQENQITLDGRAVNQTVKADGLHRLFFLPGASQGTNLNGYSAS